jgi:hypothetical protein
MEQNFAMLIQSGYLGPSSLGKVSKLGFTIACLRERGRYGEHGKDLETERSSSSAVDQTRKALKVRSRSGMEESFVGRELRTHEIFVWEQNAIQKQLAGPMRANAAPPAEWGMRAASSNIKKSK